MAAREQNMDAIDVATCLGCFANVIRPPSVIDELFEEAKKRGVRLYMMEGSEENSAKPFLVVHGEDVWRLPTDQYGAFLPLADLLFL